MDQSTIQSPTIPQIPVSPEPVKKSFPKWLLVLLFGLILGVTSVFAWQKYKPSRTLLVGSSPSPTTESYPIPSEDPTIGWQIYTDEKNGFSFKYPQSWQQQPGKPGVIVGLEGKQFYQLIVQVLDNNQRSSSRDYVDELIKNSVNQPGTLHFDSRENITLAGLDAVKLNNVFAYDRGLENIYVAWHEKVLVISYPIKAENPNLIDPIQNYSVVQQILSTFKFTEQQSATTISKQKRFGFIRSITGGRDNYLINFDPAEMVEDNTQPNDYRIDNPETTIVELQTDVPGSEPEVIMQTYGHSADGSFIYNQKITFGQFLDAFNSRPEIKDLPYWLETVDNTVTKITEQYLP